MTEAPENAGTQPLSPDVATPFETAVLPHNGCPGGIPPADTIRKAGVVTTSRCPGGCYKQVTWIMGPKDDPEKAYWMLQEQITGR